MPVRRITASILLVFCALFIPSNIELVMANGVPIVRTSVCHDNVWDAGEYCGRDAVVATGGWNFPSPPASSATPDMNHDCFVDGLDLALFAPDYYGNAIGPNLSGDFNNDGRVSSTDFSFFTSRLGKTATPCTSVPIPSDCTGSVFVSFSSNPSTIVSTATQATGAQDAYIVVNGTPSLDFAEFGFYFSPNVVPINVTSDGNASWGFGANGGWSGVWLPNALLSGPHILATFHYILTDTNPAWIGLDVPNGPSYMGTAASHVRWTTAAVAISHEFTQIENGGINGQVLAPSVSVCSPAGNITGNVYADYANSGSLCVFDSGTDTHLSGLVVKATPGPYYAQTDANGNYSFRLAPGNYSVSMNGYFNSPYLQLRSCQTAVYPVSVTANGTVTGKDFALVPVDAKIQGRVYRDFDGHTNCAFDAGTDYALPYQTIEAVQGGNTWKALADNNGYFTLNVPGGSYTVDRQSSAGDPLGNHFCFGGLYGLNVAAGNVYAGNDFPLAILHNNCVAARLDYTSHGVNTNFHPCPGQPQRYRFIMSNDFLSSVDIDPSSDLVVTLDSKVSITSVTSDCSITIQNQTANTVDLLINDVIHPGGHCVVTIDADVSVSASGLFTTSADFYPNYTCPPPVVSFTAVEGTSCSPYDPNGIVVEPGCGPNGETTPDGRLTYDVHFENIGDGPAHNVFIKDVLNANLDPSSLIVLDSDHTLTGVQLNPGNSLQFSFEGINLPGAYDAAHSTGYVVFSLKQNPGLPDGTTIPNSAAITFDFNAPIVTNTAMTTIKDDPCAGTTAVGGPKFPSSNSFSQNYPNPFNPSTTIDYALASPATVSIAIYNVRGELIRTLVSEKKPAGWYRIDWDGRDQRGAPVASGIYLSRMRAGSFAETRKLVLIK
jgi:uncharacterized repeat protein (TIGR01451 family)